MTIRIAAGAVSAPLAQVPISGAELTAVNAMGEGAFYWRAFTGAFTGAGSAEFRWKARRGPYDLVLAGSNWPTFVDGAIPYLDFTLSGATQGLRGPTGAQILPTTSHAVFCAVYQPADAEGVIWGNRANITVASDAANDSWEGLITGCLGDSDRLAYMVKGQANRTSQPQAETSRNGTWQVITTVYKAVSSNSDNVARIRIDATQKGENTALPPVRQPLNFRELRVGIAGLTDASPLSRLKGRIAALAVVPGVDFTDGANATRLEDIETYFQTLVGQTV